MTPVLQFLYDLTRETLVDPSAAARRILDGAIPREALWTLFLLVMVTSAFLTQLSVLIIPPDPEAAGFEIGAITVGVMVGGSILLTAAAATWIGRAFGGIAQLGDVLILTIWLQVVMIIAQVVQILVALIASGLEGIVVLASLGLLLWLLTNFIAVAHGFRALGQVFMMILVSFFAIAFGLSIVLVILGVVVPAGS